MDIVTLSRWQFALNISFHYLFPPLSIGLSVLLIIMEGCYLWTKNPVYEQMTQFFVKIFALIFAVGVATGLVMVFSFGNNWAQFSKFVGDVFGSILGAEGIFAFFLESGFLAILLFGWERVSAGIHFLATILVSVGAHFSGIWIVIANSWMQTPAGHKIVGEGANRHAVIDNFWQVLLNPSSLNRLAHVLIGSWLAGAFLVLSISSFYLLKKRHLQFAKRAFVISLIVASVCVVLQLISGDFNGRQVARDQPIKLAAFEGVFKTAPATPMFAFGWVNKEEQTVRGLKIPGLLSFLVYRNFHTPVTGLDQFPKWKWPNVSFVFQSYHLMIIMWGFMVFSAFAGLIVLWRKRVMETRWVLWILVFSVLFPEIANQVGWYAAEAGRQPWAVYDVLLTKDGVSTVVTPQEVLGTIIMYAAIYALLLILFIYLLDKKIKHGPPEKEDVDTQYRDPFKLQEETG